MCKKTKTGSKQPCVLVKCRSTEEGKEILERQLDDLAIDFDLEENEYAIIQVKNEKCECVIDLSINDIPEENIYCIHGNPMVIYEIVIPDINELIKRVNWNNFKAIFE